MRADLYRVSRERGTKKKWRTSTLLVPSKFVSRQICRRGIESLAYIPSRLCSRIRAVPLPPRSPTRPGARGESVIGNNLKSFHETTPKAKSVLSTRFNPASASTPAARFSLVEIACVDNAILELSGPAIGLGTNVERSTGDAVSGDSN